jgi:hypothetical protein
MSKNIYKYKIRYTNLIGGSNPQEDNEDNDDNMILEQNSSNSSQPEINNSSLQPEVNNSSLQPGVNNSSSQPEVNNSSSQPEINNLSLQPRVNNSSLQLGTNEQNSSNFDNNEISHLENDFNSMNINTQNQSNTIQFKNRYLDDWPTNAYMWTSVGNYNILENIIWDNQGIGNIISMDDVSFVKSRLTDKHIKIYNINFSINAFTTQSQNILEEFIRSKSYDI